MTSTSLCPFTQYLCRYTESSRVLLQHRLSKVWIIQEENGALPAEKYYWPVPERVVRQTRPEKIVNYSRNQQIENQINWIGAPIAGIGWQEHIEDETCRGQQYSQPGTFFETEDEEARHQKLLHHPNSSRVWRIRGRLWSRAALLANGGEACLPQSKADLNDNDKFLDAITTLVMRNKNK